MEIAQKGEVWYRYDDHAYASPVDVWENPIGPPRIRVELKKYPVLRHTPKGVWLDVHGTERFVLRDARKRFACPTIEEAQKSFLARKKAEQRILKAKLERSGIAMEQMERIMSCDHPRTEVCDV